MTGVVIVRERCAKTDPPEHEGYVWTDQGPARYQAVDAREPKKRYWWFDVKPGQLVASESEPSVWYDFPRDTERETLTVEDLHEMCNLAAAWSRGNRNPATQEINAVIARLRAAFDALER